MRVNQPVLKVGETRTIMGVTVTRQGQTDATFQFPAWPTPTVIGNLNAALSGSGITVGKYWRLKDANGTPIPTVIAGGARIEAIGTVVVVGGVAYAPAGAPATGTLTTPAARPQPVQNAPQAHPVAAPAPVATTAVEPVSAGALDVEDDTVSPDDEDSETVPPSDITTSHRYRFSPELLNAWDSSEAGVANGELPQTLAFIGGAGTGKTEGASALAARAGLPFTKVDAASQTDPESWFGIRQVVSDPKTGSSITVYHPSDMVLAIQKPGVLYIDEFTRSTDRVRQVWLPMIDGTRRVTNPLTGQVIQVHPQCRVLMGGNVGLNFSGTYQVDVAFWTRVGVVIFDYLPEAEEAAVIQEATGVDERTAKGFAAFAARVRAKVAAANAAGDNDLDPIATRQVIQAARQVHYGADLDVTARQFFFNAVSDAGGAQSLRSQLVNIWTGVRPLFDAPAEDDPTGDSVDEPHAYVSGSGIGCARLRLDGARCNQTREASIHDTTN